MDVVEHPTTGCAGCRAAPRRERVRPWASSSLSHHFMLAGAWNDGKFSGFVESLSLTVGFLPP